MDGAERINGVETEEAQKGSGAEMEHRGNGESGREPMGEQKDAERQSAKQI